MKENDLQYIGRVMYYSLSDGSMRMAVIKGIEFQSGLGAVIQGNEFQSGLGPVFIGESPHGHIVRLTKQDIHHIL